MYCNNRIDVFRHKNVFDPTQTHSAKMRSITTKNIIRNMPKNINSITIIIIILGWLHDNS